MQENTKPLVFGYPLWNKILSLIIPLILILPLVVLPFLMMFYEPDISLLIIGTTLSVAFFLILDNYVYSIFSKSVVNKNGLTYIPGGIFWKRILKRQKFFAWEDYGFYLHYYDVYGKDDINYTMLVIKDRKGKIYLKLDRGHIANFEKLAERFKEYCPAVELVEHTFIR
jgi:hypothetical protein